MWGLQKDTIAMRLDDVLKIIDTVLGSLLNTIDESPSDLSKS